VLQASQPADAAGGGAPGAQAASNPEPSPSAAQPSLPVQAATGGAPAGSAPDLSREAGAAVAQPGLPRHAAGGGARRGGAAPARLPRPRAEVWAASYEPLAGEGLMAAGRQQRAFGACPVRPSSCTLPCQSDSCRLGVQGHAWAYKVTLAYAVLRAVGRRAPGNRSAVARATGPARYDAGPTSARSGLPGKCLNAGLIVALQDGPHLPPRRACTLPAGVCAAAAGAGGAPVRAFHRMLKCQCAQPPIPATQSLRAALLASAAPRLALAALLAACWALPPVPGGPGGGAQPGGRAALCLLPALGLPPLLAMLLWQAALAAAAAAWLAVRPGAHARLVRPRCMG